MNNKGKFEAGTQFVGNINGAKMEVVSIGRRQYLTESGYYWYTGEQAVIKDMETEKTFTYGLRALEMCDVTITGKRDVFADHGCIKDAHERFAALNDCEYMKAISDSDDVYFIRKEREKIFLYTGEWSSYKTKGKYDISTAMFLHGFLAMNPEVYEKRHLSKQIDLENCASFLNAFEPVPGYRLEFDNRHYAEMKVEVSA